MAVGTLSIDLEARLGRLEGDLGRATRLIERDANRMGRAFVATGAAINKVVGLLGSTVAVGFLVNLTRNTIDGIDALNDLADATGSTVEKLSGLENLGARTGTSIDTIGAAIVKLNQGLANTKEDSGTALALKRIGLNAEELRRLDPADALKRVADALAGFADDGDKARLVQELFGKSVREVAALLKDLAEAGKLNATVTTQQAKEAEKLNQQMFQLQKNAVDVARAIASELVPAVNSYLEKVARLGQNGNIFGAEIGAEVAGANFAFTVAKLEDLQAALAKDPGNRGLESAIKRLRDDLPAIQREATAAADKLRGLVRIDPLANPEQNFENGRIARLLARPSVGGGGGGGGSGGRTRAVPAVRASDPFGPEPSEALVAALKRLESVDTAKLASLREQLQQLVSLGANGNSAALEALPGVVEEIARLDPEARAAAESLQRAADETKRLADLLGQTDAGRLAAVTEEVEFLNAQFAGGKIASVDQWAEAVRNATGKLGTVPEATARVSDSARELGFVFSSAFEDAIVDGAKLSDVLKSLEKDILRIFLRKTVTEPLGNALASFATSAFASANGNAFGPGGVIPFANGGVVDRATFFKFAGQRIGVMGERGPEAVVPLRRGRDGQLGVINQGGGRAINMTINVQATPGMSRETAMQQGAAIGRHVQAALRRNG